VDELRRLEPMHGDGAGGPLKGGPKRGAVDARALAEIKMYLAYGSQALDELRERLGVLVKIGRRDVPFLGLCWCHALDRVNQRLRAVCRELTLVPGCGETGDGRSQAVVAAT
jgi:hypothetical protein